MIRALRPTDLVGLVTFQGKARDCEVTSHTWPKVDPCTARFPLLYLLSRCVTQTASLRRAWLHVGRDGVTGVIVGRPRYRGLVWDVEHLHALPGHDRVASELLNHLCAGALEMGARRVFLETPRGPRGEEVARQAGFEKYASSVLYVLAPPFQVDTSEVFEGRPRLSVDEQPLFQLYNASVPARVRTAEAITHEEWVALHRGRKAWMPAIGGDRHQYVWEMGNSLAGWAELVYGQKSQFIDLMVHPRFDGSCDKIVSYALTQVSNKAPVYAVARDYQPALASALERAGFRPVGEFYIFVRQLAARLTQPKLVPARVLTC